jgi:hypothetical protein
MPSYCVSGAGTNAYNGTYDPFSASEYRKVGTPTIKIIYNGDELWYFINGSTEGYTIGSSSATPPLTGWNVSGNGVSTAPTLTEGACASPTTTTTTTTAAPTTTTTTTASPTTTTTTTLPPDKIRIKRSSSSTVVPATLLLGEIAANITDQKVWIGNTSQVPIVLSDYQNTFVYQGDWDLAVNYKKNDVVKRNGSFYMTIRSVANNGVDPATDNGTGGWQIFSNTVGNQGFQGSQGLQGLQGRQGATGNNGSQGFQGSTGTGSQGFQGHQGDQGSQGNQGFQGRQGFQGHQGDQGWQGEQGFQGRQGFQGHQGDQGNYGWQGYQGSQGDQGMYGWQGWQGSQGDQGMYGWQGYQGSQGDQGQGNQGSQGSQGLQGLTGPVAGSANQVVYKDGSNVAAGSSSFTFNGTTVTTPVLAISPTVGTGTQPSSVTVTAPNHTALTAATEYSDVFLNLNRTVQFSAGFLSSQRAIKISAPTYSAVSASTFTNAATIQIDSAPIAGTNLTLTNAYALRVLTGTTTGVGIVIQGASSQTGDLFRIQNFGGTNLLYVDSNYSLYLARSLNLTPFNTSAGNTSEIRFYELAANGTNYVGFKAGDSIANNVIWTLPTTDGTSGQVLSTNASGVLSWITPTSKSAGSDIFLANNFGGL